MRIQNFKNNIIAFTLIEVLLWITIVSIVLVWAFQALSSVMIWKTKLIQETQIRKDSYYFLEKMTQLIKQGGVIDYEEYFNRKVIWNISYWSWHYSKPSWYGNFWKDWTILNQYYWDNFYYCRSNDWTAMTWNWCINTFNSWSINYSGEQQRYWEYSFQFIDYNSNFDNDLWDEDGVNWIIWDDDDEYLWKGPDVFDNWVDLKELYLISANWKQRSIFRWRVEKDLNAIAWQSCSINSTHNTITWDWCIWTIEYLKLDWKDWWMDHISWNIDNSEYDWVIDTWVINKDFAGWTDVIAWLDNENYRVTLFPDSINVSDFQVYAYPNKDINYAWKESDDSINISPYVILKIKIKPSWLARKRLKTTEVKEIDLSMTINLTDIYSQ